MVGDLYIRGSGTREMSICNNCPRGCKTKNIGYCGERALKVALVSKHHFEEPIISGDRGSGTIFFSNCPLKCVFCQNYEISHLGKGKNVSVEELAEMFKMLEKSGVHNINLVSPTHYMDKIIEAFEIYKPSIPVVYNTSGYEKADNIERLKPYVDIFLFDLKYFDSELSSKYSSAKNYFEFAFASLKKAREIIPNDIIKDGIMQKGIIVRHLVLPSCFNDSIKILEQINNSLGNKTFVSLMSQYVPFYKAENYAEINRKLKPIEYKRVVNYAEKLGFENCFIQETSSASEVYVPKFFDEDIIKI